MHHSHIFQQSHLLFQSLKAHLNQQKKVRKTICNILPSNRLAFIGHLVLYYTNKFTVLTCNELNRVSTTTLRCVLSVRK